VEDGAPGHRPTTPSTGDGSDANLIVLGLDPLAPATTAGETYPGIAAVEG
jgi:hypothetical protein